MMNLNKRHYPARVRLFLPEQAPSATIYIRKPLSKLARQGQIVFNSILEADATVANIKTSDLVLFCRNRDPSYSWILDECLANDIPTVYDIDDNFWQVPYDLPYAGLFRSPERLAQLESYLSNVDLVRVYSPHLQGLVIKFNNNVHLAKPCIDMSLTPEKAQPRIDDKIRITYVTGRGGDDALIEVFSEVLFQALDKYPGQIEMHWWGEIPRIFRDHPASRMHNIIHDYDSYLYQLSRQGFDIGLAPLTATPFNLSKTNTKFRDYGASRIAGIYSNIDVYASDIRQEQTGLLVNNEPGAWFQAIARLIEDKKLRQHIQESAYQFVKENYPQGKTEKQWQVIIDTLLQTDLIHQSSVTAGKNVPARQAKRVLTAAKLKLTCQPGTPNGFIGVDQNSSPKRSIFANLTSPLPLVANCADLILVEHTLDEYQDPDKIMQEIYRLGRPGAQVCIQAVYSWPDSGGKEVKSGFNERTPMRWTNVKPPVYNNSTLFLNIDKTGDTDKTSDIDLRCVRMELFYLPPYMNHRQDQKQHLRHNRADVCDRILYHLLVVKDPLSQSEIKRLIDQMEFYMPVEISTRRMQDSLESMKLELDRLDYESKTWHTAISQKENELAATRASLETARLSLDSTRASLEMTKSSLETTNSSLMTTTENLETAKSNLARIKADQEVIEEMLQKTRSDLAAAREGLDQTNIEKDQLGEQLITLTHLHDRQMLFARMVAKQVDAYRNRKAVNLAERVFGRTDDSKELPPSLTRLADDSYIFIPSLKGFRLLPSRNLQHATYIHYQIEFIKAKDPPVSLTGIYLAPVIDLLPDTGVLGIEIVSPENNIIAQATTPASQISFGEPVQMTFSPSPNIISGVYELRVFARELVVPLRIYEWRKYALFGLGPTQTRPFMGYDITSDG